ncbi:MAG: methyltransferase domain-containing protein [Lapillicoccus sp.]
MGCCPPRGAEPFTTGTAKRDARRYARRGLARAAVALVDLADPAGLTVLEVGAGVGALQAEVLRRGATRSTGVEISPTYDAAAHALLDRAGVRDRSARVVADLLRDPSSVPAADVVLLHRVVCCTPDAPALLAAAASLAGRRLVFTYPRHDMLSETGQHLVNAAAALRGWGWRFHVHRPADLIAAAESAGLRPRAVPTSGFWRVAVLDR